MKKSRRTGRPTGRPPGGPNIEQMWVDACIWARKVRAEKQRAADAMRLQPKQGAA